EDVVVRADVGLGTRIQDGHAFPPGWIGLSVTNFDDFVNMFSRFGPAQTRTTRASQSNCDGTASGRGGNRDPTGRDGHVSRSRTKRIELLMLFQTLDAKTPVTTRHPSAA